MTTMIMALMMHIQALQALGEVLLEELGFGEPESLPANVQMDASDHDDDSGDSGHVKITGHTTDETDDVPNISAPALPASSTPGADVIDKTRAVNTDVNQSDDTDTSGAVSVGVDQPGQSGESKPQPNKRPHDDVGVSTEAPFSLDDDGGNEPAVCPCPSLDDHTQSLPSGTTGSMNDVENDSSHDSHGSPVDQPLDTEGKVGTIYEAMQWPTYHTTKLLEHMSNRSGGSSESDSDSDDDMPCPPSPTTNVPGLKKLFRLYDSIPISTAFSGIDAPGTGLSQQIAELNFRILNRNLQRHLNGSPKRESKIGEPLHLNAIEWFPSSQTELRVHPSAPRCLYGDISSFQHSYFRTMKDKIAASGKTREILSNIFKQAEATKL